MRPAPWLAQRRGSPLLKVGDDLERDRPREHEREPGGGRRHRSVGHVHRVDEREAGAEQAADPEWSFSRLAKLA